MFLKIHPANAFAVRRVASKAHPAAAQLKPIQKKTVPGIARFFQPHAPHANFVKKMAKAHG